MSSEFLWDPRHKKLADIIQNPWETCGEATSDYWGYCWPFQLVICLGKGNEPSFSPTCPICIISLHLGNWRMTYSCQLNCRIYTLDMFRQNLIFHVLMSSTLLFPFFHYTMRMLWILLFIWIQRKGVFVNIYIRKELWTALDFKHRQCYLNYCRVKMNNKLLSCHNAGDHHRLGLWEVNKDILSEILKLSGKQEFCFTYIMLRDWNLFSFSTSIKLKFIMK